MRRKSTTFQRILRELNNARIMKRTYSIQGERTAPGWIPAFMLVLPDIGGLEATRRIRQLRTRGINIVWKYFKKQDGSTTNTTLYYLDDDPETIDFEKCCKKKMKESA